jgi:hypothetical protein
MTGGGFSKSERQFPNSIMDYLEQMPKKMRSTIVFMSGCVKIQFLQPREYATNACSRKV